MKHRNLRVVMLLLALVAALTGVMAASADSGGKQELSAETQYAQARSALLYVRCYYASGALKATGSGFLVTEDGLAVTAAHVTDKAARITVITAEDRELDCSLVSSDAGADVAVLRLPAGRYPALKLAKDAPGGGSVLRAMGYPIKDTLIITEGLCSAPRSTVSEKQRMLVSCEIVNGMSGGPIFDRYGQVAGLCSGSVRTMSGIHLSALHGDLIAAVEAAQGKETTR